MIFTGGTIGSTAGSEYIGIDRDKPYKLIEAYRSRYGQTPDIDTLEPVSMLSENSNGRSISAITECVCTHIGAGYDGIIVTHGTDTIQYTAAALGYALGSGCTPVCLVSSDHPIEDPRANGLVNLHAAFQFIRAQAGRGVWVVYRNHDESSTRIHRATRLLAHQTASASLYSIYDSHFGLMDDDGVFTPNPDYQERPDETGSLCGVVLPRICRSIMRIVPYPGMIYPDVPGDVHSIIHESYHSGTVCTASDTYRSFFDQMYARRIRVYMTGTARGDAYESTGAYADMHIRPVPDMAPATLYMKLWMAECAGMDADSIVRLSLGGDVTG